MQLEGISFVIVTVGGNGMITTSLIFPYHQIIVSFPFCYFYKIRKTNMFEIDWPLPMGFKKLCRYPCCMLLLLLHHLFSYYLYILLHYTYFVIASVRFWLDLQ